MEQTFWLFIAVFLFGAAVLHGQEVGTLQDVSCENASAISFSIDIPDIAEWGGADDQVLWRLNNITQCQPTFDQELGLVTYSDINVVTCAPGDPATTQNNSKFEYKFVISVVATAGSAISPATFAYDHNYVVKCLYNREQENLMASFQPRHSLSDTGSGDQDFVIAFTVHFDSNNNEVTSVLDLSTAVYGKVEITDDAGVPENLDVHLLKVTADNDDAPEGDEFELISDGCVRSSVVTSTSCNTSTADTFDFKIFRFPGQSTGDLVYLKATVIVCLSDDRESVCQTQCNACSSGRKRRDALEQIQQSKFYVTAGPFKIQEPDQDTKAASDKDEGTALPAYVIAVVTVCGVLAVAIVSAVVLIVFRRRRQNVANVDPQNEVAVTV